MEFVIALLLIFFGGHAVSSGASVSAPAVSDPAHREHLSQLQSQKNSLSSMLNNHGRTIRMNRGQERQGAGDVIDVEYTEETVDDEGQGRS